MASIQLNEKADTPATTAPAAVDIPQLTITTNVAVPEKALCITESSSASTLTPVPSHNEKSIDLRRDSNLSTPRSCHNDNPFDTDIEAMITSSSQENGASKCLHPTSSECRVWPGQDHWKKQAKANKLKNRSCACMAHLSPRNRIIAKVAIALLIIGIAVGVGFGVSKPLGAPIWGNKDKN